MTHAQLEASVLSTLQVYWRTEFALTMYQLYSAHGDLAIQTIEYESVPQHGIAHSFLANETVSDATNAIKNYVDDRLSGDLFLAMIGHFESFLIAILIRAGQMASGTLGQLQRAVESAHVIPQLNVDEFDEVRERRNAIIHDHGQIGAKYTAAAMKVFYRSSGWVPDPNTVAIVGIPSGYLSYVADVVIRYTRAIP